MKIKFYFLICLILIIAVVGIAFAETIKLMSGRTIEGEIIERNENYIKIMRNEKILTIDAKIIDDRMNPRRRSLLFQKKSDNNASVSVRERLRAIREKEYKERQQKYLDKIYVQESEPKETSEVEKQDTIPEGARKTKINPSTMPKICPSFENYLRTCELFICEIPHPTEEMVVRHFIKGFHSPDQATNKCNYHQSIPGEEGDVIDCYLDPYYLSQFIRSLANDGSPIYAENEVLQRAVEEGVCVKHNFPLPDEDQP